jgi:hypothetical protein
VGDAVANMPTLERRSSIRHVLFEGTMLSEGRGRRVRSSCRGARGLKRSASRVTERPGLPACYFRRGVRTDVSEAREDACGGCQIHVTDRARVPPVLTGRR